MAASASETRSTAVKGEPGHHDQRGYDIANPHGVSWLASPVGPHGPAGFSVHPREIVVALLLPERRHAHRNTALPTILEKIARIHLSWQGQVDRHGPRGLIFRQSPHTSLNLPGRCPPPGRVETASQRPRPASQRFLGEILVPFGDRRKSAHDVVSFRLCRRRSSQADMRRAIVSS